MWLYYRKLRGTNDFESVNQLIVADKMFEMLDSETATHIGVLQGKNGTKPGTWANNDIFYASNSYDNPTPLAHADTSRDVLPRGGTSQAPQAVCWTNTWMRPRT
ncbi:hypothetical protein TNCV_1717981 [Trichonephila clavipes]|nr:hypothetical protein TNCV_1717981 [Trichonephila clavipes]